MHLQLVREQHWELGVQTLCSLFTARFAYFLWKKNFGILASTLNILCDVSLIYAYFYGTLHVRARLTLLIFFIFIVITFIWFWFVIAATVIHNMWKLQLSIYRGSWDTYSLLTHGQTDRRRHSGVLLIGFYPLCTEAYKSFLLLTIEPTTIVFKVRRCQTGLYLNYYNKNHCIFCLALLQI